MAIIRIGYRWRAALLYGALTLLLAYPLSIHPGTRVMSNDADTNLFMWALEWDAHAFVHQPLAIFDANIFYPQHHTLAYSENFIGSAFFAAPVLWLTGNPVLAVNLVALLSCVLCGLGGFVLARKLGLGVSASVVGGLVFAFSPPRFFRLDQLHLTTIEWVPFCLAYVHAYLDRGRARDLRIAIGFFTLQALTSGHGAALLVAGLAIVLAYRFATGDRLAPARRLRDFGIVGAALLLPTLLIMIPYRQVQTELQFSRGVNEWVTNPASFLASPARVHELVLSALSASRFNEAANAYLFPGYLPLLLAIAAFVRWSARPSGPPPRARAWTRVAFALELTAIAAACVALAVTGRGPLRPRWGDGVLFSIRSPWRAWAVAVGCAIARIAIARLVPFDLAGRCTRIREAMRTPAEAVRSTRNGNAMLYALVTVISVWIAAGSNGRLWPYVYWLPGLDFIRVPSRFILLSVLGLAMLAAMGFERFTSGAPVRRRRMLALAACAWMVVEFSAIPLGTEPDRVDVPAIDRWLATQPAPFAIAEVPLTDPIDNSEYMLHSTAHWQKTVEGNSGLTTALHGLLFAQLRTFPDKDSVDALSSLGITFVIVHLDKYAPDERAAMDARLAEFSDRLTLVHAEGPGRAYALHAR